jgi:transcriptional regulator with XRE-family HTH domain
MEYLTDIEIGERCKDLREAARLTQAQIGEALGVDQPTVSKIERGDRSLAARDILALSEYLGVPSAQILTRDDASRYVLLRSGDAQHEKVDACLALFQECIDDYFGVRALAGDGH